MNDINRRETGRYFTSGNPLSFPIFKQWAREAGLPHKTILEPFAGSNNLIKMMRGFGLCEAFVSYDLHPASEEVEYRDSIKDFPQGYEVCITNPP